MVKKIAISISDHIWNRYLLNYNGNRSAFIEDMFLCGIDSESSDEKNLKITVIELKRLLNDASKELKDLKLELGKYKNKYNKKLSEYEGIKSTDEYEEFKAKEAKAKAFFRSLRAADVGGRKK